MNTAPPDPSEDQVTIELDELRDLMAAVCRRQHVPAESITTVVEHYLDGELRGRTSHGVGKFCFESQFFAQRLGDPFVTGRAGAVITVNGNREIGPLRPPSR